MGGGLGASVLARAMAERGTRILVVEREERFRDRVRGEALAPWGVAEAKRLGIHELLATRCGSELRGWNIFFGGGSAPFIARDLVETTPQRSGWLTFYHPAMQELLLEAAAAAGAEVRRGARAVEVRPGRPPRVQVETEGRSEEVEARVVVGADGRGSMVRRAGRFTVAQDPVRLLFAGVLFENLPAPSDAVYHAINPGLGRVALLFPQRGERVRAYVGCHKDTLERRLQGAASLGRFIEESVRSGVPAEFYTRAREAGPLATFDGAETWVEHPYRDGVALVGDAAATSDPTWGQGMSLTLRDVRVLRDALLATDDWNAAGHAYAAEHDGYFARVHRTDSWFTDIFMDVGAAADARRDRALPLLAQDPSRICDVPHSGPEAPCDEAARRQFYGED